LLCGIRKRNVFYILNRLREQLNVKETIHEHRDITFQPRTDASILNCDIVSIYSSIQLDEQVKEKSSRHIFRTQYQWAISGQRREDQGYNKHYNKAGSQSEFTIVQPIENCNRYHHEPIQTHYIRLLVETQRRIIRD
jgi:hypothetical protein